VTEPDAMILHTERLTIRPFVASDLDDIHAILNAAFGEVPHTERVEWLDWTISNYTALARLFQPPYGDRAITLTESGMLIGAVGLVPSFGPFDVVLSDRPTGLFTPEMGLFWALGEAHRGYGYATEAARALITFAFETLKLKRIVAMTEYDNTPSIRVIERLGMTVHHNPNPTPEWFQVVGVLANPAITLG